LPAPVESQSWAFGFGTVEPDGEANVFCLQERPTRLDSPTAVDAMQPHHTLAKEEVLRIRLAKPIISVHDVRDRITCDSDRHHRSLGCREIWKIGERTSLLSPCLAHRRPSVLRLERAAAVEIVSANRSC